MELDIVQKDAKDVLGGNGKALTQQLSTRQWVC